MKLAILLVCHKNPEQINKFLDVMYHPKIDFFIHIDKKINFQDKIIKRKDIFIMPYNFRQNIKWGDISIVRAILNLFDFAISKNISYDYFWLCSGQDFPIKKVNDIVLFLEKQTSNFINVANLNENKNFIKRNNLYYPTWMLGNCFFQRLLKKIYIVLTGGYNNTFIFKRKNVTNFKFYFGSLWWCLNRNTVSWIINYCKNNSNYYSFYKNCVCPDESFFQTLVLNSPFYRDIKNYLHYVDWSQHKNNPKILTMDDLEKLKNSEFLMARKFDIKIDEKIIKILMCNK